MSKSGRYGGTYAHKDIAFEFSMWISPKFKLLLIKIFEGLFLINLIFLSIKLLYYLSIYVPIGIELIKDNKKINISRDILKFFLNATNWCVTYIKIS